jgi:hypothetical protein
MQEIKVDGQAPAAGVTTNGISSEKWQTHVQAAQKFNGSGEEYCRLNGLSLRVFQEHKKKQGLTRRYRPRRVSLGPMKGEAKAFLKVECQPEPPKPQLAPPSPNAPVRRPDFALPDPKWMAKFVTELLALR